MREIEKGFQIENPNVFVPWNISDQELKVLFSDHELKCVTTGYYVIKCQALNGIELNLGFHFIPRKNGYLKELEIFVNYHSDRDNTYSMFQTHLESVYGNPSKTESGTWEKSKPSYTWISGSVSIYHYVFDRFGPEEHVRIKKSEIDEKTKDMLDRLLLNCKIQPVGWGYIDCITKKENVHKFVNSLTELGIKVTDITWWCHCAIGGNKETLCPHGGGGPTSKYYDGWFSEMYQIPNVKINDNSEIVPYIFNEWPNTKEFLPCLIPAFWLDVPDDWRNTVDRTDLR